MRMYRAALMAGLLVMLPCALSACADDEIKRPDVTAPLMPELGPEGTEGTISLSQIESSTPFTAGTGANSYRIPSIVTAGDGSLLVFCEARHESWMDKSHTDIVVRRSTDNGKSWSEAVNLTASANGGEYAFMDPTPWPTPRRARSSSSAAAGSSRMPMRRRPAPSGSYRRTTAPRGAPRGCHRNGDPRGVLQLGIRSGFGYPDFAGQVCRAAHLPFAVVRRHLEFRCGGLLRRPRGNVEDRLGGARRRVPDRRGR